MALAVPVVVLVAIALAWVVDNRVHADQVPRNVLLDGKHVGGYGEDDLRATVEHVAETYGDTPVVIHSGARDLETTVGDLGGEVDVDATVEAALAVPNGPVDWARRFQDEQIAPVVVSLGPNRVITTLDELEGDQRTDPVEPLIQHSGFGFVVVPGEDGQGIDQEDVIGGVVAAAAAGEDPIEITAESGPVPPRFTDDEAETLAEEANDLTRGGITIQVDGEEVPVDAGTLGPWVTSRPGPDSLQLVLDPEQVQEDLPRLVRGVGTPPAAASFTVIGNTPRVVAGHPGTGCCAPGSARRVIQALRQGRDTVQLELTRIRPVHDAAWARSLGIREEISLTDESPCESYDASGCRQSTHHDCCESRVTNIHRIADIVRGYVIEPNGGHFSINEYVGPRTVENGFVVAGAIENGEHVESVGGGVSQFATTMFNAAFFAGLDIPDYQFHTEHLSRYPFGRESTVSYPAPNFRIVNNSPYGVLIWPTYTDTSVTVHLYSTRFATGAQTAQSTSYRGSCIDVTTTRTRTYTDGHTEQDTFHGYYRTAGPTC